MTAKKRRTQKPAVARPRIFEEVRAANLADPFHAALPLSSALAITLRWLAMWFLQSAMSRSTWSSASRSVIIPGPTRALAHYPSYQLKRNPITPPTIAAAITFKPSTLLVCHRHLSRPQSSSASRFTAGASGPRPC
jgi:hypothetical protein